MLTLRNRFRLLHGIVNWRWSCNVLPLAPLYVAFSRLIIPILGDDGRVMDDPVNRLFSVGASTDQSPNLYPVSPVRSLPARSAELYSRSIDNTNHYTQIAHQS